MRWPSGSPPGPRPPTPARSESSTPGCTRAWTTSSRSRPRSSRRPPPLGTSWRACRRSWRAGPRASPDADQPRRPVGSCSGQASARDGAFSPGPPIDCRARGSQQRQSPPPSYCRLRCRRRRRRHAGERPGRLRRPLLPGVGRLAAGPRHQDPLHPGLLHRARDLDRRRGRDHLVDDPLPRQARARRRADPWQHAAGDRLDGRRSADPRPHHRRDLRQAARDHRPAGVRQRPAGQCGQQLLRLHGPAEPAEGLADAEHGGRRPAVRLALPVSGQGERLRLHQHGGADGGDGHPRDQVRRRRALLVDPEARRQDGRAARLYEPHLVPGRQGRHLQGPVRRAVRAQPREHAGHRRRPAGRPVPGLVPRSGGRGHRGQEGPAGRVRADPTAGAGRDALVATAEDFRLRTRPRPQITARLIADEPRGWTSWITTTDHKKIGILYLWTCAVFFILGGVEALLMRIQLGVPENTFLDPEKYNQVMTMHGTTMIFLVVVPIWAGFGNYVVPLMIGARDMAFPRLNAWSYWMFLFGGIALYASLFFTPPEAGWFSYVPLSLKPYSPSGGQDAWIYMTHLTGLSSILGGINFIATIHNMRAPGMGWGRLPLFVWSLLIYSYLIILALTSLAASVTMLLLDRNFGTTFFDPTEGGSALLWQHLFWFFGHPEVYILVLPAFGVFSEVIPVFARKPIFGYKAIAAATAGIAFLGMLVWAHHMFATPMSTVVLAFFMLSSFLIAVPTGVKIFNWVATLWRVTIEYRVPLLFAIGGVATFLMGGITGIFLAVFPVDWQLTDTYFVVAHFHYTAFGASAFAMMSALYYWFPKMSGRMMSESLGKASFWLFLVGFHVTFLIQHSAGLSGMPRRVYEYADRDGLPIYNLISSIGSWILALGILLTVINLVRSVKSGAPAGPDPWKANTLEWYTPSPPPENNFDATPRVRSVEPMKDIRREVEQLTGVDQRYRAGQAMTNI